MTNINNNIQEPYCSFEVSKLLKEKGLNCGISTTAYSEDGVKKISLYSTFYNSYKYPILNRTHALAIEWIRVNFGIWIRINSMNGKEYFFDVWNFREKTNTAFTKDSQITFDDLNFDSPQEATEAALLYVLTNLI